MFDIFRTLIMARICKKRGILFQITFLLFLIWRKYFYSLPSKEINKVPLLLQNLAMAMEYGVNYGIIHILPLNSVHKKIVCIISESENE